MMSSRVIVTSPQGKRKVLVSSHKQRRVPPNSVSRDQNCVKDPNFFPDLTEFRQELSDPLLPLARRAAPAFELKFGVFNGDNRGVTVIGGDERRGF